MSRAETVRRSCTRRAVGISRLATAHAYFSLSIRVFSFAPSRSTLRTCFPTVSKIRSRCYTSGKRSLDYCCRSHCFAPCSVLVRTLDEDLTVSIGLQIGPSSNTSGCAVVMDRGRGIPGLPLFLGIYNAGRPCGSGKRMQDVHLIPCEHVFHAFNMARGLKISDFQPHRCVCIGNVQGSDKHQVASTLG